MLEIRHGDFEAMETLCGRIKAVFDRADFAVSAGCRVIHMRLLGESSQQADSIWQRAMQFRLDVYEEAS